MSNAPDRPAVVRQDLDNVIHPIVPHKQLEQQQLVIVSGKDSTVVDADRIYVLERGRMVQAGSHAELLAVEGLYASLYRHNLDEVRG